MKWCGKVGYSITKETKPGIWETRCEERTHIGEVTRTSSRWQNSPDSTNGDIHIQHTISVIADPFIKENFSLIKYIEFMGAKFKVTNIEVQYPRLLLTIGGVYNGE